MNKGQGTQETRSRQLPAECRENPRMRWLKIENFRPHVKNSLFGFIDVTQSSGLIICGVTLHRKDGSRWCGMPAREYVKADGTKGWSAVVKFASQPVAERFRDEVFAAYDESEAAKPSPGIGQGKKR
jgi:hypothetical protein